MALLIPGWPKLEQKILPQLAQSIESDIIDGFDVQGDQTTISISPTR